MLHMAEMERKDSRRVAGADFHQRAPPSDTSPNILLDSLTRSV